MAFQEIQVQSLDDILTAASSFFQSNGWTIKNDSEEDRLPYNGFASLSPALSGISSSFTAVEEDLTAKPFLRDPIVFKGGGWVIWTGLEIPFYQWVRDPAYPLDPTKYIYVKIGEYSVPEPVITSESLYNTYAINPQAAMPPASNITFAIKTDYVRYVSSDSFTGGRGAEVPNGTFTKATWVQYVRQETSPFGELVLSSETSAAITNVPDEEDYCFVFGVSVDSGFGVKLLATPSPLNGHKAYRSDSGDPLDLLVWVFEGQYVLTPFSYYEYFLINDELPTPSSSDFAYMKHRTAEEIASNAFVLPHGDWDAMPGSVGTIVTTDCPYYRGRRLHIAKTLSTDAGNVGVFVNLRSASNQNVYSFASTDPNHRITGIACNASRDYDAGLAWDLQPQSTSTFSASSVAGSANLRKTSAIKCHFFSGTHSGAMVMEGVDQWYAILFGVTNLGVPFYCCSGGNAANVSAEAYRRSKAMFRGTDFGGNDVFFAAQLWKSELNKWAATPSSGLGNMRNTTMLPPYSTFASTFVLATPDVYTGNCLLQKSSFISTDSTTTYTPIVPMGHCPDAVLINTKFLVDESVIEAGSEEWVCYRMNKDATYGNVEYGYAIRK